MQNFSFKDFIKKYKVIIIALSLIPIAVSLAFVFNGFLPIGSDLSRSDWLSFWSGLLGYISTAFLGLIAVWQNERFKMSNDQSEQFLQDNNKRFADSNERISALYEQMLHVQQEQFAAYCILNADAPIAILTDHTKIKFQQRSRTTPKFQFGLESHNLVVGFSLKNISKNAIQKITLLSFDLKKDISDIDLMTGISSYLIDKTTISNMVTTLITANESQEMWFFLNVKEPFSTFMLDAEMEITSFHGISRKYRFIIHSKFENDKWVRTPIPLVP